MSIKERAKSASAKSLVADQASRYASLRSTVPEPRIQRAIDFMTTNENLRRKIRLSELAQVANLSLSRFSHLFKSEIGLSPGQYLLGLRMEKARHLLASTRLSIKEVMAQAGYDNRSHFIRHFSRFFGAVPQKYRKRAQSR